MRGKQRFFAQSAVEYLMVTSFLLVATGLIFAYSSTNYQQATNSTMAKNEVTSIVNTVEQAYSLGEGTVLYVDVETPPLVKGISIDYVCKDEYRTSTGQECLTVDPDTGANSAAQCCDALTTDPGKKFCATPNPYPEPDWFCHDFYSLDLETLTVKRSYFVMTQEQAGSEAQIVKQSRAVIEELDNATVAALKLRGPHTLRVEWTIQGKIRITAVDQ
jgi:hypothetical protein